ncbi:MAG: hypothetical protein APF84_15260 [Gracilibacter sp. BRH_c7a]|nr:MAG: hypothetical protein APF84_15260 [Gracilibacter sp. BRH_c7a]
MEELFLRDIMNTTLKEGRLIAGHKGLDNKVKGITIIEAPDIVEWLKGGELLLTSLYNVHSDSWSYKDYLGKMAKKGVSGLIVKTGRVVDRTPKEIIDAGNEYNLPIIEIGEKIKYIDIMYPVMGELFNKQVSKLQYYKNVQDRLTDLVIAGEGLEGITKVLEELIGNPVIVYDKRFNVLASTNPHLNKFTEIKDSSERENLNEKVYYYRQEVILPYQNNRKATQVVVPIQQLNQISAYLTVVELDHKLCESEFIILENASTVISLELVKRFAIGEVETKFKYDLLDNLVSGDFDKNIVLERASLLGWDLSGSYAVTILDIENINHYLNEMDNVILEIGSIVSRSIKESIDKNDYFVRIKSDSIYVLWPSEKCEEDLIQDIKEAISKITKKVTNKFKRINIITGIGSVAEEVEQIAQSYEEAQDAINFAKILNENVVSFSELGIMRIFCKFAENNSLEEFIPGSVNALLKHDKENDTNLLNTLEVFLKANGNATRTAKELFVHYKTVLHRLERIKEIGSLDLNSNKYRLEAEIGIKMIRIIEKKRKTNLIKSDMLSL